MRSWVLPVMLMLLWGCAGSTPGPKTFDLGTESPNPGLPAVRIASVRASPPFDGLEMHYRPGWRNPSEIASYAHSRWSAPPAELLRRQLLRAAKDGAAKCSLRIEVQDFSQRFAARDTSEARIELRASLSGDAGNASHRYFTVTEPGAGADAAAGAQALARAASRAVHEIGDWISMQSACRA